MAAPPFVYQLLGFRPDGNPNCADMHSGQSVEGPPVGGSLGLRGLVGLDLGLLLFPGYWCDISQC